MVSKEAAAPSVWLRDRRTRSAPTSSRPSLSRGKLVSTAVALLDEEGLEKFSMRRLAGRLGVTVMSLYWYVDNKDDLLEFALDEVLGTVHVPGPEEGGDWREDLRGFAREWRNVWARHPWALRLCQRFLNVGPHSMAIAEDARHVVARSDLPPEQHRGALSTVLQYAYGAAAMEVRWIEQSREAGRSPDELFTEVSQELADREGRERAEDELDVDVVARGECDFAHGLDCLIAGIETLARQGDTPTP